MRGVRDAAAATLEGRGTCQVGPRTVFTPDSSIRKGAHPEIKFPWENKIFLIFSTVDLHYRGWKFGQGQRVSQNEMKTGKLKSSQSSSHRPALFIMHACAAFSLPPPPTPHDKKRGFFASTRVPCDVFTEIDHKTPPAGFLTHQSESNLCKC